jgi:trans-aconitate 2-methyltransferase
MTHHWDPKQYEKFERERNQPFFDLLQLIQPLHHPRIIDLGCGNGSLTQLVHEKFHASYTLGIDSSKEMLAEALHLQKDHLQFKEQDIRSLTSKEPFNLIISNAALQWIPDHEHLFRHLTQLLAPMGQLAIQIPASQDYPTHVLAAELAAEAPFKQALGMHGQPTAHLLSMEDYAQLLEKLGFESQIVRLQLYAHFLESTASVIEWVKGSLLTYYKSYLSPDLYEQFLKEYQQRLMEQLGWSEPFFFPMKRLFLWGQMPTS